MTPEETAYLTLINKIDYINQKLDLYREITSKEIEILKNQQIADKESNKLYQDSIKNENKLYQESVRAEIKADQDANKQQLNVSLGVLVTAAISLLVSIIIH